jgi:hypothetical protein
MLSKNITEDELNDVVVRINQNIFRMAEIANSLRDSVEKINETRELKNEDK